MKNTKGFTLIELLVVITIIGILAAGATAIYSSSQAKAKDAVRINDIKGLESATVLYLTDNDEVPNASSDSTPASLAMTDLTSTLQGTYLSKIPTDPDYSSGVTRYAYHANAADDTADSFEFNAALEATSNAAKETGDGGNNDNLFEAGNDLSEGTDTAGGIADPASGTLDLLVN